MTGPHRKLLHRHPSLLAVCALSTSACLTSCGGDGAESGCGTTSEQYEFTQDTSLGYSMSQVLAGRRGANADLSWADSRDWLMHTASGNTELIVRVEPDDGLVDEIRNADTGCFRVLRADAAISVVTADGQLEFTVDGTVTALSRDEFELEAEVDSSDLEGLLQVPNDVGLQLRQTTDGNDVEGTLIAFTTGESNLKSFDLATWEGSASSPPAPGDEMETDSEMTDAETTDTPMETDPDLAETDSGDAGTPAGDASAPEMSDAGAGETAGDAGGGAVDAATPMTDAATEAPAEDAAAPAADAGDAG